MGTAHTLKRDDNHDVDVNGQVPKFFSQCGHSPPCANQSDPRLPSAICSGSLLRISLRLLHAARNFASAKATGVHSTTCSRGVAVVALVAQTGRPKCCQCTYHSQK